MEPPFFSCLTSLKLVLCSRPNLVRPKTHWNLILKMQHTEKQRRLCVIKAHFFLIIDPLMWKKPTPQLNTKLKLSWHLDLTFSFCVCPRVSISTAFMQFIKVICRRRLSFSLTATILHVFKHDINKLKEISFHLSNMQFSTKDQDNDHHNESDCAEICERACLSMAPQPILLKESTGTLSRAISTH